jgi:hypothetical protein
MAEGTSSSPGRGKSFSLLQDVQTDSAAHPAYCTMGTVAVSPGGKVAGA